MKEQVYIHILSLRTNCQRQKDCRQTHEKNTHPTTPHTVPDRTTVQYCSDSCPYLPLGTLLRGDEFTPLRDRGGMGQGGKNGLTVEVTTMRVTSPTSKQGSPCTLDPNKRSTVSELSIKHNKLPDYILFYLSIYLLNLVCQWRLSFSFSEVQWDGPRRSDETQVRVSCRTAPVMIRSVKRESENWGGFKEVNARTECQHFIIIFIIIQSSVGHFYITFR